MKKLNHSKIKKGITLLLIVQMLFSCTTAKCDGLGNEIAKAFVEIVVETLADAMQYRYPVNEKFRQKIVMKLIENETKAYIQQTKAYITKV